MDISIHLFGAESRTDEWSAAAVAQTWEEPTPSPQRLAHVLGSGETVALVRPDRVTPAVLEGVRLDSDVNLIVTDPAAATGGRGASDLLAGLWRNAPAVAILLSVRLLDAGAVVFRNHSRGPAPALSEEPGDAVSRHVVALLNRGRKLQIELQPNTPADPDPAEPPDLTPRSSLKRRWLETLIEEAGDGLLPGTVRSRADAAAVRAGLLLWHDCLEASHSVSQAIEGQGRRHAGDLWHAIMHRREPDYGNAKYWFRRLGPQPIFRDLADRARWRLSGGESGQQLLRRLVPNGTWDPFAFIDACAEAERSRDAASLLRLRQLQSDEMLLLLGQTVRDAVA